jgi:hypothetical protein
MAGVSQITGTYPVSHSKQTSLAPQWWGASLLTLGALLSFLGLVWDVQWHTDVGPDTFFTLPHLFIYSGSAISGLACLAVVIWLLWPILASQQPQRAFSGIWQLPLGFLIGGAGASIFLFYGLIDLWWHTIYGFDVTFESPPHIGLLVGSQIAMIGCLVAFTTLVRQQPSRTVFSLSIIGFAVIQAINLGGLVPFQMILPPQIGPFSNYHLSVALIYPMALLMIVSVVRQPGAATLCSLLFLLLRESSWLFTAWATPAYAASLGLFIRDGAYGIPSMPDSMPWAMVFAGPIVDGMLLALRRINISVRLGVALTGALVGGLLAWLAQPMVDPITGVMPATLAGPETIALAVPIGALAGWAGWKLGVVLASSAHNTP